MKPQTWLRWCMRIVLPFIGWRVPVVLLRGPARASGREVVLLSAGQKSAFFTISPATPRSGPFPATCL
jgi:hypothetical protein